MKGSKEKDYEFQKSNFIKNVNGITLIALIITIIVLLILAGVAISAVVGDNGILNQATRAADEYSKAGVQEKVETILVDYTSKRYTGENPDLANMCRKELQVGVAENEDGTYSFLYNGFQVVTNENEVISIEEFNLTVDKTYPSVALMKADTELIEGQLVQTEGYYSSTYGGSAYYDIVSTTELEIDEAKCIQLDNGLYAKLHAINDTVTVNQFGAYGDGENDDAIAIQNALNSGYGNVSFESERYLANNVIVVSQDNLKIIGNNSVIKMAENFKIIENYFLFLKGTEDNTLNNISIYNIGIETGDVVRNFGNAIQLRCDYTNNLEIEGCNFIATDPTGNKNSNLTNIWLYQGNESVMINNNNFCNLSNSGVGGNIWISQYDNGLTQNITIINNYIEKSSHDESIAAWSGEIKNIYVDNNEFNIHEENVDNPSDVIFNFGNDTEETDFYNLKFSNNIVNIQTKRMIFNFASNSDNSEEFIVENNQINAVFVQYSGMIYLFKNESDFNNVTIRNNNINSSSLYSEKEYFNIVTGLATVSNNNIEINNIIYCLSYGVINNWIDNNITINGNISYLVQNSKGNYENNKIQINGELLAVFILSSTEIIDGDLNIKDNYINIVDNNIWSTNNKSFFCVYDTSLNDSKVFISNNTIEALNQTNIQRLILLQSVKDENIQKIYINSNNFGIFKNISFFSNTLLHQVIYNNDRIITTNTTLE